MFLFASAKSKGKSQGTKERGASTSCPSSVSRDTRVCVCERNDEWTIGLQVSQQTVAEQMLVPQRFLQMAAGNDSPTTTQTSASSTSAETTTNSILDLIEEKKKALLEYKAIHEHNKKLLERSTTFGNNNSTDNSSSLQEAKTPTETTASAKAGITSSAVPGVGDGQPQQHSNNSESISFKMGRDHMAEEKRLRQERFALIRRSVAEEERKIMERSAELRQLRQEQDRASSAAAAAMDVSLPFEQQQPSVPAEMIESRSHVE